MKIDTPVNVHERYLYAIVEKLDKLIEMLTLKEEVPITSPKRKTSKKEG